MAVRMETRDYGGAAKPAWLKPVDREIERSAGSPATL